MARIEQAAFTRPAMRKVFPMFTDRWGLQPYTDPNKPALFVACYNQAELRRIKEHRSLAVVMWLGGDFQIMGGSRVFSKGMHRIKHVAIGKFLEDDLRAAGLPYRRVNVTGSPLLDDLRPVPLGDKVYYYYHENAKENYGYDVFEEVREALFREGVDFMVHDGVEVPPDVMRKIYGHCAIGLRLTKHDGGAQGVIELGLMGRPCVYNGDVPNAVGWDNAETVIAAIRHWRTQTGHTYADMAEAVHGYVQWDDDWLDVDWWRETRPDPAREQMEADLAHGV